jgi:hypothetical protein
VSDIEPAGHAELEARAKGQLLAARVRAALALHAELIGLSWRRDLIVVDPRLV